jgi:radical SAM protein with 4Fe4S-binding SPASM domain
MRFDGFPLIVGWELTLVCNLRCSHCASSAGLPRPNELSLNEALQICEQFPSLLVQEVDFTGGEPLLRTDWPQIAARLRELGIPVRMVTNGVLLEESVPHLVETGVATVAVSLDGLEATHDHIRRRPGLFKKIISGVKAALAAGVPMAVITAVNNRNVGDLPELFKYIRDLGVRHWQVQPTFPLGRAREGEELGLSESSFLEMGKFIRSRIISREPEDFRMQPADGVGYFTDLDMREQPWRGCSAGTASCGITSDGKIKGCLSFPDHLIEGDLRERDLWDIWFDEKSFAFNRRFSPDDLGESCAGCEFGEQCKGGCGVMSYAATGQFHNNPYCFHGILNLRRSGLPASPPVKRGL